MQTHIPDTTAYPTEKARVDIRAGDGERFRYALLVPRDTRQTLALAWLILGMAALVASGLFSVLLVLSRTPQLQAWFALTNFFRVALVVHVDLSVLVWFLAFGGALWTLSGGTRWQPLAWCAFAFAALGTVMLCAAPFVQAAAPVMSNYVPVLNGSLFLAGLGLFGYGIGLLCIRSMLTAAPVGTRISPEGALRFGLHAAMVATAVAGLVLVWAWATLPKGLDALAYYELLFWGSGHVLQFAYVLLMLVAWVWLACALGPGLRLSPRVLTLLFAVALLAVFLTPMTYLAYDVGSIDNHRAQTLLMRYGGGLVIGPIALAVLWSLWPMATLPSNLQALRSSLLASLVLFSAGGLIGFMITGSNVRIPAHYHGCIVGVTLAMMGLTYLLLPQFGFAAPQSKTAVWQPVIYGSGQLLHITGLVWSGGYGVQRKVAGADQVLRTSQEVWGMGLMGLGGLIAIVGGLLFLVIVLRATRNRTGATA